jgi:hypothetical protein
MAALDGDFFKGPADYTTWDQSDQRGDARIVRALTNLCALSVFWTGVGKVWRSPDWVAAEHAFDVEAYFLRMTVRLEVSQKELGRVRAQQG